MEKLKKWMLSEPELPEFKKMFLVQLAWSETLSAEETEKMLTGYEEAVSAQLALQRQIRQKKNYTPARSDRETLIWNAIYDNIIDSYAYDLSWVRALKEKVAGMKGSTLTPALENANESNTEPDLPAFRLVDQAGKRYIDFPYQGKPIDSKQWALDIISACASHDANQVLLHGRLLDGDFKRLSTGLAGEIMQKLAMYGIRTAVVADGLKITGKFEDMLLEASRGGSFRLFQTVQEAEEWFVG
jgi:hypothetical protein